MEFLLFGVLVFGLLEVLLYRTYRIFKKFSLPYEFIIKIFTHFC